MITETRTERTDRTTRATTVLRISREHPLGPPDPSVVGTGHATCEENLRGARGRQPLTSS